MRQNRYERLSRGEGKGAWAIPLSPCEFVDDLKRADQGPDKDAAEEA
jgi:hypothetical protein